VQNPGCEFSSGNRYGEEHSSKDTQEEEVPASYKDRETQAGEPLKKDEATNGWIAEAEREADSWIICCMLYRKLVASIGCLEDILHGSQVIKNIEILFKKIGCSRDILNGTRAIENPKLLP
jgi:hypothetical protein